MSTEQANGILSNIKQSAEENQKSVRVNIGTLKMALREVEMQKLTHGETIFTRSVIIALSAHLRAAGITVRDA